MTRSARIKSKSGIYHVILRGANRQEIFHDDEDRMKFLRIMGRYKKEFELHFYAWCLMNNHIHLLMKEGNESISDTMKRIGVCYVSHYNWKYKTSGHLFQDRFRSEAVESERYLLEAIRYIHQNPVKAEMVEFPDDWRWSSCQGYYGKAEAIRGILDGEWILSMFSDRKLIARKRFMEFNSQRTAEQCLEDEAPRKRRTDDEARETIVRLISPTKIPHVKVLSKEERDNLLFKITTHSGLPLVQIGRILGISPSLVSKIKKNKMI
ncbi:transposase [Bacillaceae bacterium S4-13-58]